MNTINPVLKYRFFWLLVGYLMIAYVIEQSLIPSPSDPGFDISDKILHAFGYFCLMGWFVQIYRRWQIKIIWAISLTLMGVLLEFMQGWSGFRHFEVYDMFANATGVVFALLLSFTRFADVLSYTEARLLKTKRSS